MPGSGLYVNWAPVTLTGTSPTVTLFTATEITDVEITRGGKMISFYGDARRFARGKKMVENERGIKIHTANVGQFAGYEEGSIWTIVATLQDMVNGVGTGAITFTLVNAVLKTNPCKGQNNQFAGGTLEFESFADSSDADPLSFAIAS